MNKWERQPLRVGMLLGFTLIPLLAIIEEYALRRLLGRSSLSHYELIAFFKPGAFFGAVLGAGALQALASYRSGNLCHTRWHLLWHGGAIFLLSLYSLYRVFGLWAPSPTFSYLDDFLVTHWITRNLSLHCALLMLFLGLLMRSKR